MTKTCTVCDECAARGRYSKTNLKIDLREINRTLIERKNIMVSEYLDLCHAKEEIIKRLLDRSLGCNCEIQ